MNTDEKIRKWIEQDDRIRWPITETDRRKLKIEPERLRKIFSKALVKHQQKK